MLEKLIDYLLREWAVLTQAPLAFALLTAFGVAIGWIAARKFLEERISVMQQRLSDYQERLGLAPKDQTTYSKMTNRELRQATVELVPKLRTFQQQVEHRDTMAVLEQHQRISGLSEPERNQAFQQNMLATVSQSQLRNMEFQRNYRASAIALRDELLRRLPEQRPEMLPALDYGMLAGVTPVGQVADYLERLAKLLP
jgi:hypothetical protein